MDNSNRTAHQQRVDDMMRSIVRISGRPELGPAIKPNIPSEAVRIVRAKLLLEEAFELVEALGLGVVCNGVVIEPKRLEYFPRGTPVLEEIAKECADVSVVTIGALSVCGIADNAILEAVDANNLAKFGTGCKMEGGKLIKSPDHPKPDILGILQAQGWSPPENCRESEQQSSQVLLSNRDNR